MSCSALRPINRYTTRLVADMALKRRCRGDAGEGGGSSRLCRFLFAFILRVSYTIVQFSVR